MRARILWIATALTVVYAVVIVAGTFALWPEPGEALTLSQFGDYLSGVFSPLAFGWFVVTVFIQLEELRLQRLEMRSAREEAERRARGE
jgi:hypothetical protein